MTWARTLTWTCLAAATLLGGCDAQVTSTYRGEPMVSIRGDIEVAPPPAPLGQVWGIANDVPPRLFLRSSERSEVPVPQRKSLRKIIKTRGSFPNDDAALKLLYLAIKNAGLPWRRGVEWTAAMGQFAIAFGARFRARADVAGGAR
jgi:hypothetical protein